MGSVRLDHGFLDPEPSGPVRCLHHSIRRMLWDGPPEEMSGTLTFTPDGEDARGEERVVRIEPISEFGPHTRYRLVNCGPESGVSLEFWEAERLFGTSQPGEYAIRGPLPDEPKPVAVWERPKGPRALSPYLCSICSCLLSPRDLDKRCRGCKSPLASTPSPWPGTTDQLAAQVRQGG